MLVSVVLHGCLTSFKFLLHPTNLPCIFHILSDCTLWPDQTSITTTTKWLNRLFDARAELATFVATRREGRGTGSYVEFLEGSFNFGFRYTFSDGRPDTIIRFPKPGHTATAYRDEKVTNEVQLGLTSDSPHNLGPFIIMDYVTGTLPSNVLKKPDEEDLYLSPNIDNTLLDKIYYQIARYLLQLSHLTFPQIGAISKDNTSNTWHVLNRPLTYNMNELVTVSGYAANKWPAAPFDRASNYLASLANEHLTHLYTQRNIADDTDIAQDRFIARHLFKQLISKYYPTENNEPSILFCDYMRPLNMLIDPKTLQITAILDFEFTNAMPAAFSFDPPWWLLLSGPEVWLERCELDEFLKLYEPRMEQFLRALARVEHEMEYKQPGHLSLSARMRESWRTGQFWFDYAARKSFVVDVVYWDTLLSAGTGVEELEEKVRAELEFFKRLKMEQLKAYKEECLVRFCSDI
ncbi:uncharacterized protein BO88DRAFT_481367 [Aspergillus vadensis CBS 113365]|uniref:Uncharacterized protein n=1 Tax=Aspergillus vadensis (strain CBS 113365 / IMI 142717 / IBT 24658) TaxID=1448311 RepID=A0A319BC88_ASPVC|nr:hypothetical protein BO88DRAFT_481367 [Aspergillus vadensis CBS 113365]PYH69939.1 hypothetical protein BO88DRAFT_481367 [Aspergillus vadensis CBS 113365]